MFILNYTIPQELEMCLRLVVACACGALIGIERERRYKDAGLRTHIIVCCSAALMMIVSKYGFNDLLADGHFLLGSKGVDPSRIAAQVISGVSFIGAGVIFHNKNNTKGLTTASGLWAIAGVGIAIGAGMYGIGIFTTVLIGVIQTLIHRYYTRMGVVSVVNIEIVAVNSERLRNRVEEYIKENTTGIRDESVRIDGDIINYSLIVKTDKVPSIDSINAFFAGNEDIKSVNFSTLN